MGKDRSPQIQPNAAPPGHCVNGPLSSDCLPMYGQSWGTVYDTINYTTTGALGDYFDSSIGLRADGIDNEMSYSHLDKDIAFDPQIEQLHVDGNVGLIYAHVAEVLNTRQAAFTARGLKGYVPDTRVRAAERPSHIVPRSATFLTIPHSLPTSSELLNCTLPPPGMRIVAGPTLRTRAALRAWRLQMTVVPAAKLMRAPLRTRTDP